MLDSDDFSRSEKKFSVRLIKRYCWSTFSCRECGKMRGARCGLGHFVQPGDDASDIDRHRRHHLLQMRLGQPAIAGAPGAKGPHTLGESALNAGPPRVTLSSRFSRMSFAGRL